jgi:hypothetical protein
MDTVYVIFSADVGIDVREVDIAQIDISTGYPTQWPVKL